MKKILFLIFSLFLYAGLFSAPAEPGKRVMTTTSGAVIEVSRQGDEFGHWYVSEDGIVFELTSEGLLSETSFSAVSKKRQSNRTATKTSSYGLAPKIENIGLRKNILLLIEYADVHFQSYPEGIHTTFDSLLNGANYKERGNYGSVKQFYSDNSNGQFELHSTVVGPVRLSRNRSYYGVNNSVNQMDMRPREMVREALDTLHAQGFDFSEYGINGELPSFHVIFANYGEEANGAPADAIWSHKGNLYNLVVTYDGVRFDNYTCSPELSGSTGANLTNVGIICHELGHAFGLPDFYDTDGSASGGAESKGLGYWSVMAKGSWNGRGCYPPFFNTEERALLGWHTHDEIYINDRFELEPVRNEAVSYRLNTKTANEYFVLEVRKQDAWDSCLPGEGLMIYHVDKNSDSWNNNKVNDTLTHQCFRIKSAVNNNNSTDAGDAWPQSGKTEFTDFSTPDSKSWAGVNTGRPITDITKIGDKVSFVLGDLSKPNDTLYALAGANGSIEPSGKFLVPRQADQVFHIKADRRYVIDSIVINATSVIVLNETNEYQYNMRNIRGDSVIRVVFKVDERPVYHIINSSAAAIGGSISPKGNISVLEGDSLKVDVAANSGYLIDEVTIDGTDYPVKEEAWSYTFRHVDAAHSIYATFKRYFTIDITTKGQGSATPAGEQKVVRDDSLMITFNADAGYLVDSVVINGSQVLLIDNPSWTYTFRNVSKNNTIHVVFKEDNGSSVSERALNDALTIYPNPLQDQLTVLSNDYPFDRIQIVTLSGQLVFEQSFNTGIKELKSDFGHLPKGVYVVKIRCGGVWLSQKVIKL